MEIIKRLHLKGASNEAIANACKEYFWLFSDRKVPISKVYEGLIERTGYYEYIMKKYYETDAVFDIEEIIKSNEI